MKALFFALLVLLTPLASWSAPASQGQQRSGIREVVLSKDNSMSLDQIIDGESVSKTLGRARELDTSARSSQPIYLFLNTPGGSIQDGLELIEGLKTVNRPIATITLFSASMGFQTVQNLGRRLILKNGILMSHKAKGAFQGEFGDGMSQIDTRYALWMERILQLDNQTVRRTNGKQTLASYRKQYENEMWLTGDRAVAMGYADEVVGVRCDKTLDGTHTNRINIMGIIDVDLTYSDCPVITYPLKVEIILPTNKGEMKLSEFLQKGGVFKGKEEAAYGVDLYTTDPTLTLAQVRKILADVKNDLRKQGENRQVIKGY